MKNHDSDDDFLDALYQQSATEKPPANIDKQILALAKAQHQKVRFSKTMSLQRVFSVAAVMVFSIYIFFEVDKDNSTPVDQELLYPSQNMLRSAPADAPSPSVLELQTDASEKAEEVQAIKQLKLKQAKKSIEQESSGFMADEISELSAEEASDTELSARSEMPITLEHLEKKRVQETSNADEMLKEITELLASGKMEEAKMIYDRFKESFPEYPVPETISHHFKMIQTE